MNNHRREIAANLVPSIARGLFVSVLLLATGCDYVPPGKPDPANRPQTPAEVTSFEQLFARNCAGCHGAEGKLGPAPPLNDPLFLAIVPDEELLRVIADGRANTPMPAFARKHAGTLSDEQIGIIAVGLKKHWQGDRPATQKLPGKLPEYVASGLPGNVERGAKIFVSACADCHGEDGKGAGDDEPPGRINDSALLSLMSDQGLRRIVITGRHDLSMPSFASDEGRSGDYQALSSEDIADVVALLASWRTQKPDATHSTVTLDAQKR